MYSTASISIHVWDILQAADKFKASLLELGKFSLFLTSQSVTKLELDEDYFWYWSELAQWDSSDSYNEDQREIEH